MNRKVKDHTLVYQQRNRSQVVITAIYIKYYIIHCFNNNSNNNRNNKNNNNNNNNNNIMQ